MKKRYLKNSAIQQMFIPQYEQLTLAKIGAFASQQADIMDYLPDEPDLKKVPKSWIVSVCAAVIGDPFR